MLNHLTEKELKHSFLVTPNLICTEDPDTETLSHFFLCCPLFTCEGQILLHKPENANTADLKKNHDLVFMYVFTATLVSNLQKLPAYLPDLVITFALHQKKVRYMFND